MLKSILFCTLLCGLALSKELTLEWPNVRVMNRLSARNLFTVKMRDHLYSLTWKNETHVEVFSTNQTEMQQSKRCTFNAMEYPFGQLDSRTVLNTAVFGDNRTIVAVGFRYPLTEKSDPLNRYAYYDMFFLDLINCTYKAVVTAHLSKVPVSFEEQPPQLIAYNNTFDVFFNNEEPRRYNSTGLNNTMEHKPEIDFDKEYNSFYIRLLDPEKAEKTYFYVYNYNGDTAVMKILDKNFNHDRLLTVKYQVDVVSVNKDVGASIGVCYIPKNRTHTLHCERFDAEFLEVKKKFDVSVPHDNVILNATLLLDNLGNAFVGVLHAPLQSTQRRLAVFIYNYSGNLFKSYDLGNFDSHFAGDYVAKLDSYIVEGLEGQYCIVAYEVLDDRVDHHTTHIKCFPVPKE